MGVLTASYLSIAVATIASFLFGWLWYGPLLGKQWMRLANIKKQGGSMLSSMMISLVTTIIMVVVFSILYGLIGINGWMAGVTLAFWLWLGFFATTSTGAQLWEGKPWSLWLLNNGYTILMLFIIGAIIGRMN